MRETAANPRFAGWLEEAAWLMPAVELPDARPLRHHRRRGGRHLDRLPPRPARLATTWCSLERSQLTSGSTFHSAGLVGQLRGSVTLTKMMMYSVELYRRLGEESEIDPGWTECGGIRLASARSGWRSSAARLAGRRPSACRWS